MVHQIKNWDIRLIQHTCENCGDIYQAATPYISDSGKVACYDAACLFDGGAK